MDLAWLTEPGVSYILPAFLSPTLMFVLVIVKLNVNHVEDITWNPESFDYLEVDHGKKELVRALIQSHILRTVTFDDIVAGKGIGLILNLHGEFVRYSALRRCSIDEHLPGPPGVGKTLTAEAMCEGVSVLLPISVVLSFTRVSVVRRPLYMVGAGDLGGTAHELDKALNVIFALATEWQAIVLIDEADVFLEKRAMDDLTRNAMVAVFLRQLEYVMSLSASFPGRTRICEDTFRVSCS